MTPKGLLFDYGNTLVEEVSIDLRAGNELFVMVSADYAVRTLNALLFETAAARLNIPAADIWFVGDRLDTDMAGAKAAGMTAVWFNARAEAAPSTDADLTVASWADFARAGYFRFTAAFLTSSVGVRATAVERPVVLA